MTIPSVAQPLTRLRAFRAAWNAGDVIDESSGLTAEDLDIIIHQSAGTAGEVPLEDLTPELLARLPHGEG